MIRKYTLDDPISNILTLIQNWMAECNQEEFGMEINPVKVMKDIIDLMSNPDKDLFVKINDGQVVGLMGMKKYISHLCDDAIASEHFWYVLPEYRGSGLRQWIETAREWANEKECKHFIINASNLSSDLQDKLSRVLKKIGMRHIESSFIMNLKEI